MIACDGLNGAGGPFDLTSIPGAGGGYMQREQMPKGINCHVDLRTLLAFAAIAGGTFAALGRGAQGPVTSVNVV